MQDQAQTSQQGPEMISLPVMHGFMANYVLQLAPVQNCVDINAGFEKAEHTRCIQPQAFINRKICSDIQFSAASPELCEKAKV